MVTYRRGVLQEGRFGWAGRSGMTLTDGWFWARRAGGYNVYLGRQALSEIDFDHPVAACGPAARTAAIGGVLGPNQDYWLAIRTISRFGLESEDFCWLRLRTDGVGSGRLVPDQVRNLRTDMAGRATIRLVWEYEPRVGVVRPSVFRIYNCPASRSLTFESSQLAGEVPYREGLRTYIWDSTDMDLVTVMKFSVRAQTQDGVHDGTQSYIIAKGDPEYPGDVERLDAEQK